MANASLQKLQEPYNSNHEKHVRFECVFALGDFEFVERPPLSTSPAAFLVAQGYTKLLPRHVSRYRIISVRPGYAKIWLDGLKNTVCIKRITRAPQANEEQNDVTDVTPMENNGEKANKPRKKPYKNRQSDK